MRKINLKKYFLKILLSIVLLIYCFFSPFEGIILVKNNEFSKVEALDNSSNKVEKNVNKTTKKDDEINIYFYPLGEENPDGTFANANAEGDSYIITIGDVEILVDGGIDTGSNEAIMYQMRQHVSSDNKWDYIIVTHADKDHIGAFTTVTNNVYKGIFSLFLGDNPQMTLGTIIDFDITQDSTVKYSKKEDLFVSNMYKTYAKNRDEVIKKGTKYFTSTQCCWKKRNLSTYVKGATDKFYLNKNKTISLNILYNYYSDHKFNDNTAVTSADRNNVSVCFTIDYLKIEGKTERLLFTGDLEEYNSIEDYKPIYGETKLIENNPQLKEGVVFYKAGHHGSRTSSSKDFIDAIKPQNVVITAIAGNNSNRHLPNSDKTFPAIEVTENLIKYTDNIYIPTVANYERNEKGLIDAEGKIKTIDDYYGKIHINYSNSGLKTVTSNLMDGNKPLPISETDWFSRYRTFSTYVFDAIEDENTAYFGECTLVKYGETDIVIDCGIMTSGNIYAPISKALFYSEYINKLKNYCSDGIIEYLVVSTSELVSLQQLVDRINLKGEVIYEGVLSTFGIKNIIDFGQANSMNKTWGSNFKQYQEKKKELVVNGCNYISCKSITDEKNLKENKNEIIINKNLELDIMCNPNYEKEFNYGVCVSIRYKNDRLLFLPRVSKEHQYNIMNNAENKEYLKNVVFFKLPYFGKEYNFNIDFLSRLYEQRDDKNFFIVANTIEGQSLTFIDEICVSEKMQYLIRKNLGKTVFSTMKIIKDKFCKSYGDIKFTILEKNTGYFYRCGSLN